MTVARMQGWGWRAVVDPGKVDAVVERWRHSVASGEPFEMEFPLRGADGELRWFLTRARPLHDAGGHIVRWFGSSTNIDERRRNDDFREMFLGILGHDLRNPLSTILMTSRLLAVLPDTPDAITRKLARVTSSGVRMQRMIEQLLDLTRARLTDGIPVQIPPEALDLSPIVARIVDEIRAANPARAIEMSVDGACMVPVDADRLEQVVSNLLGNAVAHGDTDRPIEVVLQSRPDAVSIAVLNQGPAIAADVLPTLFDPFVRGVQPRIASAGLGLGLYISERIIAAHGGTLTVVSTQAAGTRFEVLLPRRL